MPVSLFICMFFAGALFVNQTLCAQESGARFDIGINEHFAFFFAATFTDENGNKKTETLDMVSGFDSLFLVPLPSIGIYYQWCFTNGRIGLGLSGYSFIFISFLYPTVFVESDFSRFSFNAKLGGGIIYAGGLGTAILTTEPFIVPDISLWFRPGDIFRVGVGATCMAFFYDETYALIIPYVGLRWSLQKR